MPIPARAVAALLLAALTACAAPDTALEATQRPPTARSATPGLTATPGTAGTPGAAVTPGLAGTPGLTATPTSTATPGLPATPGAGGSFGGSVGAPRDGDEPAACRDADCEVTVRAGDRITMDGRHGVDRLTVVSLDGDGVRIELRGSSGSLSVRGMSVSVQSTCDNGRCRDVGALTLLPDTPGRINDLRLRVRPGTGESAILVLSPR